MTYYGLLSDLQLYFYQNALFCKFIIITVIFIYVPRYHRSISVSELYKMRDIIEIREQGGAGRMVYLASSLHNTTTTNETADGEVSY